MNPVCRLIIAALLVPAFAWGQANSKPPVERLKAEIDKYAATLKGETRAANIADSMKGYADYAVSELAQGNLESAEQTLRQIRQSAPSPGVIAALDELTAPIKAAREKKEAAFVTRVDELAARTTKLCLEATDIRQFDSLLAELAEARGNRNGGSEVAQRASQKLEAVAQYARRWQDYLDQKNAGNHRMAAQIMSELANNSYFGPVLPRSELLTRARAAQNLAAESSSPPGDASTQARPVTVTIEVNTLEDVLPALEKLRTAGAAQSRTSEAINMLSQLNALQAGMAAVQNGQWGVALHHVLNNFSGQESSLATMPKLKRDLLMRILPRMIEAPDALQPTASETPAEYVMRVMQNAKDTQNWLLLLRTNEAYASVAYFNAGSPQWLIQDRTAIAAYVVGLNQEKAGDTAAALASYRAALGQPSRSLPVDDVAARVKALSPKPARATP